MTDVMDDARRIKRGILELSYRFGSLNMIPDVTPNGVFAFTTNWVANFIL